jgi:hypothetical protein
VLAVHGVCGVPGVEGERLVAGQALAGTEDQAPVGAASDGVPDAGQRVSGDDRRVGGPGYHQARVQP